MLNNNPIFLQSRYKWRTSVGGGHRAVLAATAFNIQRIPSDHEKESDTHANEGRAGDWHAFNVVCNIGLCMIPKNLSSPNCHTYCHGNVLPRTGSLILSCPHQHLKRVCERMSDLALPGLAVMVHPTDVL